MNVGPEKTYLANYHTHTYRCQHATGTDEDYVRRALELGYDCIGFSDHTPWPYASDFRSGMRMPLSALEGYLDSLRRLRDAYGDRIRVLIGLECEAFPAYYDWLAKLRQEKKLDYLILGNHYDTTDEYCARESYFGRGRWEGSLTQYARTTVGAMETGLFAYVAHPDVALFRAREFDAEAEEMCAAICGAAERLGLPLEYNLLGAKRLPEMRSQGYLGYCTEEFWKVAAEYRSRAIIGVDAHDPEALNCADLCREARQKLSAAGIPVAERID